jgi:hypothetical protein
LQAHAGETLLLVGHGAICKHGVEYLAAVRPTSTVGSYAVLQKKARASDGGGGAASGVVGNQQTHGWELLTGTDAFCTDHLTAVGEGAEGLGDAG